MLQRRAGWWVPWVFLGVVVAFPFGLGAWSERRPPHQPITAAKEALYLEFAKTAREQIGDKRGYLSFDPNYGGPRTAKEEEISERLLPMVPDYWPRRFLVVYLENDCVVLTRGTGMLGQVGVRIYDRGPVTLYSTEELRENPYLPHQQKITDRLWFFISG